MKLFNTLLDTRSTPYVLCYFGTIRNGIQGLVYGLALEEGCRSQPTPHNMMSIHHRMRALLYDHEYMSTFSTLRKQAGVSLQTVHLPVQ